jgi:purine-nucleoside phosphorylase
MTLFDAVSQTVAALEKRNIRRPRVGVVLGSGLGDFANELAHVDKIPYSELPHMPLARVPGHAGNLCFGQIGAVDVVCLQGRVHLYEGHDVHAVVHGVRTMARLGVRVVLLTNAAGGLDPTWSPGDLMVVTDHLNLMATSPLVGPNDERFGPRFPDMTQAYDRDVRSKLFQVAKQTGLALREGVYAGLLGPSYETPAEIRMLRVLGADAVGMSTVPEVLALRHLGVAVGALSCISNLAAGLSPTPLSHREVEQVARSRRADLIALLSGWVRAVGEP